MTPEILVAFADEMQKICMVEPVLPPPVKETPKPQVARTGLKGVQKPAAAKPPRLGAPVVTAVSPTAPPAGRPPHLV